jgi:phosphopantetheinyl transferase
MTDGELDGVETSGHAGTAGIAVCYCLTEALDAGDLAALTASLSADERARRDRFVFERDRRDFAVAHGLLRHQLSFGTTRHPKDWLFRVHADGKPSVVPGQAGEPALTFSLSHTHGLVACVVARGVEVGIDVERIDRARGDVRNLTSFFSADEQQMLRECSADDQYTRTIELWTLKEAYVKGRGAGLRIAPQSLAFAYEHGCHLNFSGVPDARHWQFLLAEPSDGSRLAVAVHDRGAIGDGRVAVAEVGSRGSRFVRLRSSHGWAKS